MSYDCQHGCGQTFETWQGRIAHRLDAHESELPQFVIDDMKLHV